MSSYAGFSAQDVQDVLPEAVSEDSRGYLTLSDRPIIAALVNAVKELKEQNEQLKKSLSQINETLEMNRSINSEVLNYSKVSKN